MKDECFLIFVNKKEKIRIGLNNKSIYIFNAFGTLELDRTKIKTGRTYTIDGVVYRYIGNECNKIPKNTRKKLTNNLNKLKKNSNNNSKNSNNNSNNSKNSNNNSNNNSKKN